MSDSSYRGSLDALADPTCSAVAVRFLPEIPIDCLPFLKPEEPTEIAPCY